MSSNHRTIAVIGGGASGVLTAAQLLARIDESTTIEIFERRPAVARGTAYSTSELTHLLNVPACSMTAFPDQPLHFVDWLAAQSLPYGPKDFVPRLHYGRYLEEVLARARAARPDQCLVINAAVTDVIDDAGALHLQLDGENMHAVDQVVVATGHLAPSTPMPMRSLLHSRRYIANPWNPGALDNVPRGASVILVGSGLTAVDVVLALVAHGHNGSITMVSRHGALPHVHHQGQSPAPDCSVRIESDSPARLLRSLRREIDEIEAAGGDWRQVIDGIRPSTNRLWRELDPDVRARCWQHLRRYWDIHRHRMAPAVGEKIARLIDDGQLRVQAGHVIDASADAFAVTLGFYSQREGYRSIRGRWIVNCTGPDERIVGTDPLLTAMARGGLIRAGAMGVGIDTDSEGRVVDRRGDSDPKILAIGPLRRGTLVESTAIPEIRQQAAGAADVVLGEAATKPASLVRLATLLR